MTMKVNKKTTNPELKTLEAVVTGKIKNGEFRGREYAIIPIIALREGVLFGANYDEPQYVPAQEIEKTAIAWNGRPLTRRHPEVNGQLVPAGSPGIFDTQVIGFLFNADFQQDKLRIEAWIDKEHGSDVIERAQMAKSGEKIEVSTGYFSSDVDQEGEFKGQSFNSVQTNLVPDHLAVLAAGEKGACSWEDGCGAMRVNLRSNARRPKFSGTENDSWEDVDKSFTAYAQGYLKSVGSDESPPGNVSDAPAKMKQWIASKTLLGNAKAENEDDLIFFPIVNPSTNKLNRSALTIVLKEQESDDEIPAEAKESAQNMARTLLDSEYGDKRNTGIQPENILDDQLANEETTSKVNELLNRDTKSVISVHLNHAYVWEYDEEKFLKIPFSLNEDGEVSIDHEPIEVKAMTRMVANAEGDKKNCKDCGQKTNECACKDNSKLIETILANESNEFSKEELQAFNKEALEKLNKVLETKKPEETHNKEGENDEVIKEILGNEENTIPEEALKQLDANTLNSIKENLASKKNPANMSANEYLKKHVPAEFRDVLSHGLKAHQDEVSKLVKVIKDNEHNEFSEDELRQMDFNTLKRMARIADKEDYSGNSVVNNAGGGEDNDSPPEPPTMKFEN